MRLFSGNREGEEMNRTSGELKLESAADMMDALKMLPLAKRFAEVMSEADVLATTLRYHGLIDFDLENATEAAIRLATELPEAISEYESGKAEREHNRGLQWPS